MRRVSRRQWVLGGLSGLSTSCLSPTLPPLPPPNQPETHYVDEGLLLVEGRVPVPEARVVLLNVDTSRLAGQLIRDHRYNFLVAAQPGHVLELWYEVGRERSDPIQFVAPPHSFTRSDEAARAEGASPTATAPSAVDGNGGAVDGDAGPADAGADRDTGVEP